MNHFLRRGRAGPLPLLVLLLCCVCIQTLPAQSPGQGAGPGVPPTSPPPAASRGALLHHVRDVPGDAKPILLDADEIFTWNDGPDMMLLLTGKVLVQHSISQARFERGVARIDVARYRATNVLKVILYAEGPEGAGDPLVRVEAAGDSKDAFRALLELNSRGELQLRAHKGKVQRQDRANDPLVARARAAAASHQPAPAPVVRPPEPQAPAPLQPPPGGSGAFAPPPPQTQAPLPPAGRIQRTSLETPQRGGVVPAQYQPSLPPGVIPPIPERTPDSTTMSQSKTPLQQGPYLQPEGRTQKGSGSGPLFLPSAPQVSNAIPPVAMSQAGKPDLQQNSLPKTGGESPLAKLTQLQGPAAPVAPAPMALDYQVSPRTGKRPGFSVEPLEDGRSQVVAPDGIILTVGNVPRIGVLDVEADRGLVWITGDKEKGKGPALPNTSGKATEVEFYLSGHVVLRAKSPTGQEDILIECEEMYYNAKRNVMVAVNARLEARRQNNPGNKRVTFSEPLIVTAPEILRTGVNTFEVRQAEIYSSKLPSDPDFKLLVAQATITNQTRPRTDLFGRPVLNRQGQQLDLQESIVEARNVVAELSGVPFFYTPYLRADARDPLGPLETVNLGANRVYGFQAGVGLNVWKLFGVLPPEGTRWRLLLDYLSRRGPAVGTNFDYFGILGPEPDSPDDPHGRYEGLVRAYGIYDQATDILGGDRPNLTFEPSGGRGRATWRQGVFDLPEGFNVISQISLLSDRNFLEQYFKREFDSDPNQATFVYLKQQQDNWAWSGLIEPRLRHWVTETQWLPRLDGYLIGQSIFDTLTYNAHLTGGYASLALTSDPPQGGFVPVPPPPFFPPYVSVTDQQSHTGRLALMQELAAPFDLGALRIVPYGKLLLAGYSNDINGQAAGQVWGGAGVRANLPLSRLYQDACSELFNVNGLNHKIVLGTNYFIAGSTLPFTQFAQLDRLNDDMTDQAMRDFRPYQPLYNPVKGLFLKTSPLFSPQDYAIRRLIDNRLETLDDIQVVQFDLRQRLQTKRGAPGSEHIIDWMMLDTSFSYFPDKDQNFGKSFAFIEYQYIWNLGDRTTFESTGWFDPIQNGPRVFTAGMYFNRPDRTQFYLGYRQIDPLSSRVVTGSVTYIFSEKYAMTASSAYDFGQQAALTNTLVFTRTGTDLRVSLGVSYNSLQKNFGAILEIVPNLLPVNRVGSAGSSVGGLMSR